MYESYYGFSDDPFRLTPDRRFCFPHKTFRKAKAYLEYGMQREEGFVMVTGAPGTGKTTLIEAVLAELDSQRIRVVRLNTTRLAGTELVRMIAYALDLQADHLDKATLLRQIIRTLDAEHRNGRSCLLVVDEAQGLPDDALEELRFLTNLEKDGRPLLQIFLIGQDGLREVIDHPKLEQLQQRLIAACHLRPMDAEEARAYMEHRLARVGWDGDPHFEPELYPVIREITGGVPRRINQVCARLLMYGFVEDCRHFGPEALQAVLTDLVEEGLLERRQAAEARALLASRAAADAPAPEPSDAESAPRPRGAAAPAAADRARASTPRPPQPEVRVQTRGGAAQAPPPGGQKHGGAAVAPVRRGRHRMGIGIGVGVAALVFIAVSVYFGRDLLGLQSFSDVRDMVSALGERVIGGGEVEAGAEYTGEVRVRDGSVSVPRQ
ncbi:ExeA family protein [Spiribacter halobius]|uniref:General secretion pathway protein n=1 Tax=Sediminicurvatus halobius TaxID=2182432 RepID=A0A2U2N0I7_9GAMM|nr:AAA family ATPase [Spiribacter halobius]PWG62696.1 general secretion pathway protein [Spiribacter halobius]UEX77365.1 AAA family ATPase [Spiribacter halobius]